MQKTPPAIRTVLCRWCRRCGVAAACALAVALLVPVLGVGRAVAAGSPLLTESFTGSSVSDPKLLVIRDACLTAATAAPPAGASSLGVCPLRVGSPAATTPGYLQLTDATGNRAGAVLFNQPVPSKGGIDATFDQYQYAGTTTGNGGGDGISFFLVNGAGDLGRIGTIGGALGYAQSTTSPGVDNGYVQVGLDGYGNNAIYTSGSGTGCTPTTSPLGTARRPDSVVVRGPGNGLLGYCVLTGNTALPAKLRSTSSTPASAVRTVHITITPAARLTVSIDFHDGKGFQTVINDYQLPDPLPPTVKFGLAASTGGATNVHLIRDLKVSSVEPLGELTLVKTVQVTTPPQPPAYGVGATVPYQFVVTNTSLAQLKDVTVTDPKVPDIKCDRPLPAELDAAGTVGPKGATMVCTGSHVVTQDDVGTPSSGNPFSTLTNTATAKGLEGTREVKSDPSSATVETASTPAADLSVVNEVAPGRVVPGRDVAFDVTVTNHGADQAFNVVVSDPLPAGFSFVSSVPGGCAVVSGAVSCPLGPLAAGASVTVRIVLRVPSSLTSGFENTARVSSTTGDPNVSNNTATKRVRVRPMADLALSKEASAPAVPGTNETYTLKVENLGPSDARHVVVSDKLPAQLTFESLGQGCSSTDEELTCTLPELAAGDSHTFTFVGHVASSANGFVNAAHVTSDTPDPEPENNTASVPGGAGTTSADLRLVEERVGTAAAVAHAVPGTDQTFTLTVHNFGPSDAQEVRVTDVLAGELSFVSAGAGCSFSGATVTCELASLASGGTHTFELTAHLNASFEGSELSDTSSVSSRTDDPNERNNVSTSAAPVAPSAGVTVDKTSSPDPVVPGEAVTFTLKVENLGPSDAHNVEVSDPLPEGFTFVSADKGCSHANGTVTCRVSSPLAAGDTHSFSFRARLQSSATADFVNVAIASSSTPDPEADDDDSSLSGTSGPSADLAIAKKALGEHTKPGSEQAFTITVRNLGPSDAVDTVVSDPLPRELEFRSASIPCTAGGGIVSCHLGTLTPDASRTFRILTRITGPVPGERIVNTAMVSSGTFDPDPHNNQSTVGRTVDPKEDVQITKTTPQGAVRPGGQVVFALLITNRGAGDVHAVTVSDTLPAHLRLTGAHPGQGSCAPSGNEVTCQLGTISAGGRTQILIEAAVTGSSRFAGRVRNAALVTADEPDPSLASNRSQAAVAVNPGARPQPSSNLQITKHASARTTHAGQTVHYTLTVTNHGPHAAPHVHITDTPGLPLHVLDVHPNQGACTARGAITCRLGTIPANRRATVTITARAIRAGTEDNTATVTTPNNDPDVRNNITHTTTTITPPTGLRLTKTATPTTTTPGHTITYRLTVHHTGNQPANNTTLCDQLPAALAYTSSTPRSHTTNRQHCWTINTIPVHATRTFTLTAKTRPGATATITNHATLTHNHTPLAASQATIHIIHAPPPQVTG